MATQKSVTEGVLAQDTAQGALFSVEEARDISAAAAAAPRPFQRASTHSHAKMSSLQKQTLKRAKSWGGEQEVDTQKIQAAAEHIAEELATVYRRSPQPAP